MYADNNTYDFKYDQNKVVYFVGDKIKECILTEPAIIQG